jgi:hypothetical protein
VEKIQFEFLGLHLQEPMALLFNWIIAGFCFFAFSQLGKFKNEANFYWRVFYLTFGISTVFGGLGHLFFNYTSFYGKFPCWILGCVANGFAATGMLHFKGISSPGKYANAFIWIKSIGLCVVSILTQKFIFVAIDAILTYIIFTGVYAFIVMRRNENAQFLKNMVIGVIILTPSAFIFIFKLDPHKWLNKDDLSHILMFCTICYFYKGIKEWGQQEAQLKHV